MLHVWLGGWRNRLEITRLTRGSQARRFSQPATRFATFSRVQAGEKRLDLSSGGGESLAGTCSNLPSDNLLKNKIAATLETTHIKRGIAIKLNPGLCVQ